MILSAQFVKSLCFSSFKFKLPDKNFENHAKTKKENDGLKCDILLQYNGQNSKLQGFN